MARKLQLGAVWVEAVAIFRSEFAVLAPIAVAFMGLASFLMAQVRPALVLGKVQPGAWLLLLVPLLLWSYFGSLTIATLVLEPNGPTVKDALRRALRQLGTAIRVLLLLGAAGIAMLIPLSLLLGLILTYTPGGLAAAQAGRLPAPAVFVLLAALIGVTMLLSRLLPLWALIAAENQGAIATLRRLFRITRGQTLRMFGLAMALVLIMLVSSIAISVTGGSLLLLLGTLTGLKTLAILLADTLAALVAAMFALLTTVTGVVAYRKLI